MQLIIKPGDDSHLMRTKHSHTLNSLKYSIQHNTSSRLEEPTEAEINITLACLKHNTKDLDAVKALLTLTDAYPENRVHKIAFRIVISVERTSTRIFRRAKPYQYNIMREAMMQSTHDMRYNTQQMAMLIARSQDKDYHYDTY